jgi:O-antigen ligase
MGTLPLGIFRYVSLRDMRAVGLRSLPLTYSECLLMSFFLLLSFSLESDSRRSYWRGLFSAALVGLAIFFSQTRGAWLGLAGGLLVLMAVQRRRHTWRVAGAIMILAGFAFWAAPTARLRLMSVYRPVSGQSESSKDVRRQLWAASLATLGKHPLTGAGTGNFRVLLPETEPGRQESGTWTESHDIYLQQAAEKGVVGIGLFLWMLWGMGKLFKRAAPPWRDGFLAGFAGLLICGLTESWCNDSTVLMMVFALTGSAWQIRAKE